MKRILLVDDETELRQSMVELIPWNYYGYDVVHATENGELALNYLANHAIDIVLTDLIMPKMDGLKLTTEIKKNYPDKKIIILSNYSDFTYVKEALLAGADDYLLKASFSESHMVSILDHLSQDLPTDNGAINLEMGLKFLLSNEMDLRNESTELFSNFQTPKPAMLAIDKACIKETSSQEILAIFHSIFPKKLIITSEYKNWIVYLIDTSLEELAIQKLVKKAFKRNDSIFFVGKKIDSQENIHRILLNELIPRMHYFFSVFNEKLVWTSYILFPDDLPFFDKEHVKSFLKVNEFHKAFHYLITYAQELKNLKIDEEKLKDFATTSFFILFNELEKRKDTPTNLFVLKMDLLKKIHTSPNRSTLLENYLSSLEELKIVLHVSEEADQDNQIVDIISTYIYENTQRPLSLKEVAELFHYNYSYLSSLFTQKKQMSFTEYVTKIKIQKSKVLLEKTEMNISEVADAVGFSDISYFSKVFKKEIGQTPSFYKRGIKL